MKKINFGSLISLYTSFVLQKLTIIIYIIFLSLITLLLLYLSDISGTEEVYASFPKDFHLAYFQSAMLFIQIFNSILVVVLVVALSVSSLGFDKLYLSYISRGRIVIAKIINILIVLLILVLIEELLMLGIAFIRFNRFCPSINLFISFIYLYLSMVFESAFILLITGICPNIFVSLLGMFVFVVIRILCNNNIELMLYISNYIPIINYNQNSLILNINNPLICVIWTIILFILYSCIYNIKDIK